MVQLWPDSVVERAYECLRSAWPDRKVLEGWGTRLLAPIPKKTNPELKDLRPLMLIEVTRKIWMGLIMNRVRLFWTKHKLLDERQHAYLRGKGTQTAIPQFVNAMESAREFATDLYMSSWDMSRAFDNLSREMLMVCLRRLHISPGLAEQIISLDEEDHILVRTPWLLEKLRSSDPLIDPCDFFKALDKETSPLLSSG